MSSWQTEFGPDWQVPPEIDALVSQGLATDRSWHNDISPAFEKKIQDPNVSDESAIVIWVEHPDPTERELNFGGRFIIMKEGEDGQEVLVATDNVHEAISAFLAATIQQPSTISPDPKERMYDLNRKGPSRTPEENEELRGLIGKHGRPGFIASTKIRTTTGQIDQTFKIGDIVKFRNTMEKGDEDARFVVLEPSDGGRVLVKALGTGMSIPPTYRYRTVDLEIADKGIKRLMKLKNRIQPRLASESWLLSNCKFANVNNLQTKPFHDPEGLLQLDPEERSKRITERKQRLMKKLVPPPVNPSDTTQELKVQPSPKPQLSPQQLRYRSRWPRPRR